jgi:hypothetical protein
LEAKEAISIGAYRMYHNTKIKASTIITAGMICRHLKRKEDYKM